ncbi:MAG: SPOR domain-containing protein [Gammaproteobacteria bacterium]|nr:SPOR domain-containing protein [Gammaproteobacteria bacterium]
MTKDYAKKRRPHVTPRRRTGYSHAAVERPFLPPWAWMIAGLLLGLMVSGILYWKLNSPFKPLNPLTVAIQEEKPASSKTSPKKQSKAKESITTAQTNGSRFDFYTVLPTMSKEGLDIVDTNNLTASTLALALQNQIQKATTNQENIKETSPQAKANIASTEDKTKTSPYVIQAGSFRQLSQAEELKAQLALSGFEASIQTFKLSPRDTRYRVFIGPFTSKDKADFQQAQLEQTQPLHSVVLKIGV